jgi:calcineurin-like phosphoesterase family protein
MTDGTIARWNEVVAPGDDVYIVGDLCWKSAAYGITIVERLSGRKHLVRGNHDKACLNQRRFRDLFVAIADLMTVKVADPDAPGGQQRIVLCHYALQVWDQSHRGAWHLHGHSHGTLPTPSPTNRLDVGADTPASNYAPIPYAAIKAIMSCRTFEPVDEHEQQRRDP